MSDQPVIDEATTTTGTAPPQGGPPRRAHGRDVHPTRTILDGHTAWQELTADVDVEYRPDGLRIEYASPELGRKLMSILHAVSPTPVRGGHRRNGELSVGY